MVILYYDILSYKKVPYYDAMHTCCSVMRDCLVTVGRYTTMLFCSLFHTFC